MVEGGGALGGRGMGRWRGREENVKYVLKAAKGGGNACRGQVEGVGQGVWHGT